MARTGKIARLPRTIREQLNRRLTEGEPGVDLVAWLNAQAEVRAVLAAQFQGREINEVNLTEWKQGGFAEWQIQRDMVERVRDLAGDAAAVSEAGGPLADHLASLLTARYALAFAEWDNEPDSPAARQLRLLSVVCHDLVALRRGDHSAGRMKLEQEQFALMRRKVEEMKQAEFEEWASQPAVLKRLLGIDRSYAARVAHEVRDVLGLDFMGKLDAEFKDREANSGFNGEGI
jgi:hypothetical protein